MPTQTYVSIDIETTGPTPGIHAMISLGAVAFNEQGEELSAFSVNLQVTDGMRWDSDTLAFWNKQSDAAWLAVTRNPEYPYIAVHSFEEWLRKLMDTYNTKLTFVCWPTIYDMPFVQYYWRKYYVLGEVDNPVKLYHVIDIKTMAMLALDCDYNAASKARMPREWFPPDFTEHTHVAVEDAREQGYMFFQIRQALRDMMQPKEVK